MDVVHNIIQDGRRLECHHCMFSFMFPVMCTEKRIITAAHTSFVNVGHLFMRRREMTKAPATI